MAGVATFTALDVRAASLPTPYVIQFNVLSDLYTDVAPASLEVLIRPCVTGAKRPASVGGPNLPPSAPRDAEI